MSVPKTLYTEADRRCNLHELDLLGLNPDFKAQVLKQADAVACMIQKNCFSEIDNLYRMKPSIANLQLSQDLVDGEKYNNEKTPGYGTAFLVGKRLVATAGHCVCKTGASKLDELMIKNSYYVFGFNVDSDGTSKTLFEKRQVYYAKKVVAFELSQTNSDNDWALVKLDRDVEGIQPLQVELTQKILLQSELYMLGHPSGLPIKYTYGASVREFKSESFSADLDAFAGNSGSPVFSKTTQKVVGILIRGGKDYEPISQNSYLNRTAHVFQQSTQITYETCRSLYSIDFLRSYLKASQGDFTEQYKLGNHYADLGDQKKALSWLKKAADLGHLESKDALKDLEADDPREPLEVIPHRYRKLIKGMHFEVECLNKICSVFQKRVYIQKGIGSYEYGKEVSKMKCPSCDGNVAPTSLKRIVFWDCQYTISGHQSKPKKEHVTKVNRVGQNMIKSTTLGGTNVSWNYVDIVTK